MLLVSTPEALMLYIRHRFTMRSRSNLLSLAHKQACSLASLDYVACGSTGRAVVDRVLVGPPAETKMPPFWVAFLLVDQLGLEPRTDRL